MSKRFSNIMLLGSLSMMGSVIPSGFINSFDYTTPSIDNSKKHKAKAKKAKTKRNRKR